MHRIHSQQYRKGNLSVIISYSQVVSLWHNFIFSFCSVQLQHDEELHEAVLADASEVKGRQDTDTIEIIDEIRYHITCGVQTYSEVEDANDKLKIIDTMLENLGLEA